MIKNLIKLANFLKSNKNTSEAVSVFKAINKVAGEECPKATQDIDLNTKNSKDKETRVLIRFSGTEPLIRLLVEGKSLKKVEQKAKILELEIRNIIGQ